MLELESVIFMNVCKKDYVSMQLLVSLENFQIKLCLSCPDLELNPLQQGALG